MGPVTVKGSNREGRDGAMLRFAVACLMSGALGAHTAAAAEAEVLTVPTETFRAAAADADSEAAAEPRAPLAPSLTFRLPPPTRTELSRVRGADGAGADDAGDEERPVLPVQQVGIGRNVTQLAGGALDSPALLWQPTADGGQATALAVASGGAKALRVRLVIEGAPPGLEVRVYDATGKAATVAAVPAHQLPAAAGEPADLWTPTVPGDATTVELYLPPGTEPGELKVSIPVLSHLDLHPTPEIGLSPPGLCSQHIDVACAADEISDATRRSVATFVYTKSTGGTGRCTGTLLNDANPATQIPYFLTARHCVENQQVAYSMEIYWLHERASCGGPDPEGVKRQTGGATVLAAADFSPADTGVDHVLVRLNSDPPDGVAMAGWTTAGTASGDTAVAVHHPIGALKKLGRHSVGGFTGWYDDEGSSHIVTRPAVNLQPGSSGSGLWKRIDGADYLVGVASGVSDRNACEGDLTNYHGRFDRFYPKVRRWLGPTADVADSEHVELSRLVLVDGATRAEVADLTAGDAVVDLGATASRSFDIVAEMNAVNARLGRVSLTLTGPRSASHASDFAPYSVFGPGGGGGLTAGSYQVSVAAYGQGVADGTPWLQTDVPFEVTGNAGDGTAVTGLTLAVGGGPRIVELVDGAAVTVYAGEPVELRARTSGGGAVGSVAFALSGAGTLAATTNEAPFAVPATLAAGTYRITATPHAAADGGGAAGTALAVTGVTVTVAPAPVTGFTLVDASGGLPDPDIGPLADEATVDLSAYAGWASVRADLAASAPAARIELALDGPRPARRTVSGSGVAALFGEAGGDYVAGAFLDGDYTLTATPYAGPDPRDVLPAMTVTFTVTGGHPSVVTGFTLIDAGGEPPDPDFAAIADGATLDLGGMETKRAGIRAELVYPEAAGSVRLELRGPVAATRTVNEAPYLLFGRNGDDIYDRKLPDGTYTLTARPFSRRSGSGEALTPWTVTFTITGSGWDQTRVSGFTLIDATGGPPDPAIGAIAQDATVPWPGSPNGDYSIRADLSDLGGVGSVVLRLYGPVSATRAENNDESPFTVFGDNTENGDIRGRWLPRGHYYIEATPFAGRLGHGNDMVPQTASFTLAAPGPDDARVAGFTLVDAGASPAADVGRIAAGATVDVAELTGGASDIRADIANFGTDVRSVAFELRGPRNVTRTDSRWPFSLFSAGARAGQYAGSVLPNGAYTLTATPYPGWGGAGDAMKTTTIAFTVTGSFEPGAAPVTGFTLVDARDGLPDPDLGSLADGATVNLSDTGGLASVRAELAPRRPDVGHVQLTLRGPVAVDRTEPVGAPVSLFGDSGGDYVAEEFADGAYTLTARPVSVWSDTVDVGTGGWTRTQHSCGWYSGRFRVRFYPAGDRECGRMLDGYAASDLVLETRVRVASGRGTAGLVFRTPGNHWLKKFTGYYAGVDTVAGKVVVGRMDDGVWHELAAADVDRAKPAYRLKIVALGSLIEVFVDGTRLLEVQDTAYRTGRVGLRTQGTEADWDYVDLATLRADPDWQPPETTVAFTVTSGEVTVSGFTLLDAADGVAEPDLGTVADGATLDLSSTATGAIGLRAEPVAEHSDAKSVVLTLRGPRNVQRTVDAGAPWRIFGAGGGVLPNGTYTLTATPYTEAGAGGHALPATTVTFTVIGSFAPGAAPVTGFTLVDAAGALPDPDLEPLVDGAEVDLTETGGLASVRAELAPRRPDVAGVVLALRGARSVDRTAPARAPVSLFGDRGGDYEAGEFPGGDYTLTARPVSGLRTDGFDAGAAGWTPQGGAWRAADGVYRVGGGREGKALLDGFEAADLVLEADVRPDHADAGVVFRASDMRAAANAFRGYFAGVDTTASKAVVGRMDDRRWHRLARLDMNARGPWYRLKVVATGPRIEVFVDGEPVLEVEDATYASGAVGLRTWGAATQWDNVAAVRLDDPDGLRPETAVAFTVPAAVPAVAIEADGAATEGGAATFTITADPAPAADLVVDVSVTQGADDDYLPDTLPTAVTIAAGATEATLSVDAAGRRYGRAGRSSDGNHCRESGLRRDDLERERDGTGRRRADAVDRGGRGGDGRWHGGVYRHRGSGAVGRFGGGPVGDAGRGRRLPAGHAADLRNDRGRRHCGHRLVDPAGRHGGRTGRHRRDDHRREFGLRRDDVERQPDRARQRRAGAVDRGRSGGDGGRHGDVHDHGGAGAGGGPGGVGDGDAGCE